MHPLCTRMFKTVVHTTYAYKNLSITLYYLINHISDWKFHISSTNNYWQSNRCIGVSYMYWPKTHWFFYSLNFSAVIFAGVVVPPLISFLSWELTIVFGVDRKTRRRFDKFFSKHRISKDGSIGFVLFCTEVWINFHISIHMLISNQKKSIFSCK